MISKIRLTLITTIFFLTSAQAFSSTFVCKGSQGIQIELQTDFGEINLLDSMNVLFWTGDGYIIDHEVLESNPPIDLYQFRHHETQDEVEAALFIELSGDAYATLSINTGEKWIFESEIPCKLRTN